MTDVLQGLILGSRLYWDKKEIADMKSRGGSKHVVRKLNILHDSGRVLMGRL